MRGDDDQEEGIFSYISPEKRVPTDHPLRPLRKIVDEILKEMSPKFQKLYCKVGRPSIAPERLWRSLLLPIFYSVLPIADFKPKFVAPWQLLQERDKPVGERVPICKEPGSRMASSLAGRRSHSNLRP
jgi:hypothetical protein